MVEAQSMIWRVGMSLLAALGVHAGEIETIRLEPTKEIRKWKHVLHVCTD